MLWANDCEVGRAAEVARCREVHLADGHHVGVGEDGVVGHALRDPVVAAEQLEDPHLFGSPMAKLPAAPEVNPVCAIWPSSVIACCAVEHCCRMSVPDLAAVALLHVGVGGEDAASSVVAVP